MTDKEWYRNLIKEKFKPRIVVLDLNDPCYLNCNFCPKNSIHHKFMTNSNNLEKIFYIIDYFIELGVQSFEITPTIGDSINNKNIIEILDYIKSKNKKAFMFTSLLGKDSSDIIKKIPRIIDRPDFYLVISIYGLTKKTFFQKTNSNDFLNFKKNLFFLLDNFKELSSSLDNSFLILRNRFNNSVSLDYKLFESLEKKYSNSRILFESYHPDIYKTNNKYNNICCNFLINFGCNLKGEVRFCNYAYGAPIIGNIFDGTFNQNDLNKYFEKYLNNEFCKNCILYEEVENKHDIINESYKFKSFKNEGIDFNIGLTKEI